MTTSPITTAYLDLSPDIRARAEEIAGSNRPVSWPEVLLLVGMAMTRSRWQPIETAPRDGSLILAANLITGDRYVVGWKPARDDGDPIYGEDHWDNVGSANAAPSLYFNAQYFTHWQPLPAAPETEREAME